MFWKKKKSAAQPAGMSWDPKAQQALDQAINQAPVPGPLKGRVKKELMKAAEDHARRQDHTAVSAEDLMQGMLAKMPAGARAKVEAAMQQGPQGLENLKDDLEKNSSGQ